MFFGKSTAHLLDYIDAEVAAINESIALLPKFVDRGELSDFDYIIGDLTSDETYRDLDISSIVGVGERLVMLQVQAAAIVAGATLFNITKGHTAYVNRAGLIIPYDTGGEEQTMWIKTNASGVIQYMLSNTTWMYCNIVIRGWFEL